MSLGLNDLKKKSTGAGAVTENWARGSKTARPWTSSGLTKGPKARKAVATDACMNAEWANDHAGSMHAFDMEVDSAVAQLRELQISLKEQAVAIERKIKRAAMGPFEIAKSFLQMVQK